MNERNAEMGEAGADIWRLLLKLGVAVAVAVAVEMARRELEVVTEEDWKEEVGVEVCWRL